MALLPQRMDGANGTDVPMYRLRYGMPMSPDFFLGQPYRNIHGPPRELYLSDMKDSRFYPNVFTMRYEGFRVKIKVSLCNYNSDDIKVEIQDNFLVLEAKHEEREVNQCFVTRQYKRRINLPPNAIADEVNGKWTPQRWLSIYIPLDRMRNVPDYYSPTGNQRPLKPGDKPAKPKKVRPVSIRIADF